jgi:hypothetical protein
VCAEYDNLRAMACEENVSGGGRAVRDGEHGENLGCPNTGGTQCWASSLKWHTASSWPRTVFLAATPPKPTPVRGARSP